MRAAFDTILLISFLFTVKLVNAQIPVNNIDIFKKSISAVLSSEVNFKGYSFEGFSLLIKINQTGEIDTTLISLSAFPQLRDRLNIVKKHINYTGLKNEAKANNWKSVNIILPVFALFESSSPPKSFKQLSEYANNRLSYFSSFDGSKYDSPVTSSILLSPLLFVITEPVR